MLSYEEYNLQENHSPNDEVIQVLKSYKPRFGYETVDVGMDENGIYYVQFDQIDPETLEYGNVSNAQEDFKKWCEEVNLECHGEEYDDYYIKFFVSTKD